MIDEKCSLDLSIIIPTVGRPEVIQSTLRDLCKQDAERWECLIVAQSELDPEPFGKLARETGRDIRILRCSQPNASLARNIGLMEARGAIVLFLDDDLQITNPSFLKAHLKNYDDPSVSGVFGQVLGIDKVTRTSRHPWSYRPRVGWLYFPPNYDKRCKVRNGTSCNLSVRREWAISVGGMDAQFEKGAHREESDFCLRFTDKYGELVFEPEASVIHLLAGSGGCRSWGHNRGIHPLHHITGEWYFLLKNLKERRILWRDLPDHMVALLGRQIWNKENKWQVPQLYLSVRQSIEGYREAKRKLRDGPRYIAPSIAETYRAVN